MKRWRSLAERIKPTAPRSIISGMLREQKWSEYLKFRSSGRCRDARLPPVGYANGLIDRSFNAGVVGFRGSTQPTKGNPTFG